MRKYFLFLVGCYGLASGLWAGPIYNYTATSASVRASDPDNFDLMASAPGFLIPDVGGGSTGGPPRYSVGDTILLTVPGGTIEGGQPATVDFGGFIAQVSPGPGGGLSGYAQATADQGSFVLPPNPAATYTFPARITGQFTATASLISGCGTDASSPSSLDYRVEAFELDPRINGGELPIDALARRITFLLPSSDLTP